MKTATGLTTTALCLVLNGCSEPSPAPAAPQPATPAATAAAPLTTENQGVLTDNQREGLNGADEVNDVLKQADEARRKQMEAQEL
jgi:hypothetical protein